MPRVWSHNHHYYSRVLLACPSRCRVALDVGCGEGDLSIELLRVADHVIGLDSDPVVIERARERSRDAEWRCESFLESELPRADFITFVASLHHMDMRPTLDRALSLLQPGGVLCVIGMARSTEPRDWLADVGGFVASRTLKLFRPTARSQMRLKHPQVSYRDVRTLAHSLPGAHYERLWLFRYLLEVNT